MSLAQRKKRAIEQGRDPDSVHRDAMKVAHQKRRARLAGLPFSLTIDEWNQTLTYFENQCVYHGPGCKIAYDGIDHYIPVIAGGGTIRGNCFPVCEVCNTRKDDFHGKALHYLGFPEDALARIETYRSTTSGLKKEENR